MAKGRNGFATLAAAGVIAAASQAWAAPAPVDQATMPDVEQGFIAAVQKGREAFRAGTSEDQKAAARSDRAKAICQVLKTYEVVNWRGRLETLPSNNAGKGVLVFAIADGIFITAASAASPTTTTNDLIAPDSALYRRVAPYKAGEVVNLSGTFAKDDTDCVRELGRPVGEAMERPNFALTVSDVSR